MESATKSDDVSQLQGSTPPVASPQSWQLMPFPRQVQISCLLPWVRTHRWPSWYVVPESVRQVPTVGVWGRGTGWTLRLVTSAVPRCVPMGVAMALPTIQREDRSQM